MAKQPVVFPPDTPNLMTTFVFNVRNVPAALFKALGGFATNGVNMTKLESYMVNGTFKDLVFGRGGWASGAGEFAAGV